MENKNILNNHSVEDHETYLILHLGDEDIIVTPPHKETMQELCDYLDCINLMIPLVADQSDCICKQDAKITKLTEANKVLTNGMVELNDKIAKLGSEKNELFCKMEAFKDANARLGEQAKCLKATVKSLEDANDFNEECRKMHLNAVKKDLDEAVAEKRIMAVKIDELQIRVNNQESLIKRLRAVAERNAKDGFETARKLVEMKKQRDDMAGELNNLRDNLCDIHDWIETVVDTQAGD